VGHSPPTFKLLDPKLMVFIANGTRVRFVLTQKESAILFYIQKKLGIGTVKHFPQGTSGNKNDFYR